MMTSRSEHHAGHLLLVALMAFTILPFLSIFLMALQPSGSLPQGLAWPDDPQWANFAEAFEIANMSTLLKSSFLIVLGVVPVSLLIGTSAGFGIGLLRVPGSRFLLLLFVFGLTLPIEGVVVPLYYLVRDLGLLNSRLAIILPLIGLFMPFSVFWMHAHFSGMPAEITKSAQVDGAGALALFRHVHVPLARAPIASLAILLSLWTWNQFLLALVLVEDPSRRTMAGALGAFQGQRATDVPLLCAGTIVILAPTLLTFLVLQRQLIAGLLQGAGKG
jgi:raffinose/stachyose/melibiose transport system permease protein